MKAASVFSMMKNQKGNKRLLSIKLKPRRSSNKNGYVDNAFIVVVDVDGL